MSSQFKEQQDFCVVQRVTWQNDTGFIWKYKNVSDLENFKMISNEKQLNLLDVKVHYEAIVI